MDGSRDEPPGGYRVSSRMLTRGLIRPMIGCDWQRPAATQEEGWRIRCFTDPADLAPRSWHWRWLP